MNDGDDDGDGDLSKQTGSKESERAHLANSLFLKQKTKRVKPKRSHNTGHSIAAVHEREKTDLLIKRIQPVYTTLWAQENIIMMMMTMMMGVSG